MAKYHVTLVYEQTEHYKFDDIVEADNPDDALNEAREAIEWDISPYSIGDETITEIGGGCEWVSA